MHRKRNQNNNGVEAKGHFIDLTHFAFRIMSSLDNSDEDDVRAVQLNNNHNLAEYPRTLGRHGTPGSLPHNLRQLPDSCRDIKGLLDKTPSIFGRRSLEDYLKWSLSSTFPWTWISEGIYFADSVVGISKPSTCDLPWPNEPRLSVNPTKLQSESRSVIYSV